MHSNRNQELYRKLHEGNVLGPRNLERAMTIAAATDRTLEDVIVDLGQMPEETLVGFLADWLNIIVVSIDTAEPDITSTQLLGENFSKKSGVVVLESTGAISLLACLDPRDKATINTVEFHLEKKVKIAAVDQSTLKELHEIVFEKTDLTNAGAFVSDQDLESILESANEGPTIKLVHEILSLGAEKRASDIHFEDQQHSTKIRYRIDGILETARELANLEGRACHSRLKIMADLNISESRYPQDGRFQTNVRGRKLDVRMSVLPTQFGESIALRILDQSRLSLTWENLGFQKSRIDEITSILRLPNGIFLVTGPTGSGKTTSLNTALSQMDLENKKAISIEDPIEYTVKGVNQVAVNASVGLSFANALRSVLRQDPDIVLVGEIRDQETAENAVRAALMGRLVLSTVHTNSAAAAITRLRDLGIPDFLLSTTLRGILSQRLLRKNCEVCRGQACSKCNETGYRGRVVASELLSVTNEVGDLISKGVSGARLEAHVARSGITLAQDAKRLVQDGITSNSEVYRVLGS